MQRLTLLTFLLMLAPLALLHAQPAIGPDVVRQTIERLVAKHGEAQADRIRLGVRPGGAAVVGRGRRCQGVLDVLRGKFPRQSRGSHGDLPTLRAGDGAGGRPSPRGPPRADHPSGPRHRAGEDGGQPAGQRGSDLARGRGSLRHQGGLPRPAQLPRPHPGGAAGEGTLLGPRYLGPLATDGPVRRPRARRGAAGDHPRLHGGGSVHRGLQHPDGPVGHAAGKAAVPGEPPADHPLGPAGRARLPLRRRGPGRPRQAADDPEGDGAHRPPGDPGSGDRQCGRPLGSRDEYRAAGEGGAESGLRPLRPARPTYAMPACWTSSGRGGRWTPTAPRSPPSSSAASSGTARSRRRRSRRC